MKGCTLQGKSVRYVWSHTKVQVMSGKIGKIESKMIEEEMLGSTLDRLGCWLLFPILLYSWSGTFQCWRFPDFAITNLDKGVGFTISLAAHFRRSHFRSLTRPHRLSRADAGCPRLVECWEALLAHSAGCGSCVGFYCC